MYAAFGSGSDNVSWNETYADTKYLVGVEADLNVNQSDFWDEYDTANTTWFQDIAGVLSLKLTELTSYLDTWFGGKDSDDLTEGSVNLYDNQSWNETFANTLYSGSDNVSWNETFANTLYSPLNYGDDWNKTYADTLYAAFGSGSDNASWNETFADTLYYDLGNSFGYYNSTDFSINDYYLNSNPYAFWNDTYATFNKTYADTLYAAFGSGNASWNETYADTLYADIGVTGDNSTWNEVLADGLYIKNDTTVT